MYFLHRFERNRSLFLVSIDCQKLKKRRFNQKPISDPRIKCLFKKRRCAKKSPRKEYSFPVCRIDRISRKKLIESSLASRRVGGLLEREGRESLISSFVASRGLPVVP